MGLTPRSKEWVSVLAVWTPKHRMEEGQSGSVDPELQRVEEDSRQGRPTGQIVSVGEGHRQTVWTLRG
jgi:hypothetical protein